MTTKEQIKQLKKVRIQEIIGPESTLTREEKLRDLASEELWPIAGWIQQIFEDWERELKERVEASGKSFAITDDFIIEAVRDWDRGSDINIDCIMDVIEDHTDDDGNIEVVTCRGSDLVIVKTRDEVIDQVYKYFMEKQIVGFKFDW
jgi:hypothetical protein